jgi:hypothetical protein
MVVVLRARICKRLRSPRIDSEESILPTYSAVYDGLFDGPTNRVIAPGRQATKTGGIDSWAH